MPLITTLTVGGLGTYVGSRIVERRGRFAKSRKPKAAEWRKLLHADLVDSPDVESDSDPEDEDTDFYLGLSVASLGVAVAAPFMPLPLGMVSAGGIVYTCIPIFQDAYAGMRKKQLRVTVIDTMAILGLVAGRLYIPASLSCSLYYGGRKLMLMSEDRSRKSLVNIFGEQPKTVWVLHDGDEVEIPFEEIKAGDTVVVEAGQVIPVDGQIVKGNASIDQHMLTGEAQPFERTVGDDVFAATVVLAGRILIETREAGNMTVAAQIGEILTQTIDYRTTLEAKSQKFAHDAVVPFLGLSGVALASTGPVGATAILNSFYNDSLRLSSPLTMLNFLNVSSQQGILIKDGRVLELLSTVDTVVFDKTGTLTLEEPHIGRIHTFNDLEEDELLRYTAAVEAKQSHPIARAIVKSAENRNLTLPDIDDAAYKIGYGIEATIGDRHIQIGSARFMQSKGVELPPEVDAIRQDGRAESISLVYVAFNNQLAGILELHPTVRAETQDVINALKKHDLELIIISGDQERPTQTLADSIGIDRYFAEVLPQDKAELVQALQAEGRRVCFVGDGINDAIALKQSTVSISLSGATTAATDTAQVILMDGSLTNLPSLFEIGEDFGKKMRINIAAAAGPAAFSIGSVFLLGTGVPLAIILYNVSIASSLANAALPGLRSSRSPVSPAEG